MVMLRRSCGHGARSSSRVCLAPGFGEARSVGSGLGEDGDLTVVLSFELGRWDKSDLAVQAPVVEQSMYSATAISTSCDRSPRALVGDQLGLDERVERLSQGVDAPIAVKQGRAGVCSLRAAAARRPRVRGPGVACERMISALVLPSAVRRAT